MKKFIIPVFIALVLAAGCLGAGNTPNSGGGLHRVTINSHQIAPTPSEDVTRTNTIPVTPITGKLSATTTIQNNSFCGQLAYCNYLRDIELPLVSTPSCDQVKVQVQQGSPQVLTCFMNSFGVNGQKEMVKVQCSNGFKPKTTCEKQGVPYSPPAK